MLQSASLHQIELEVVLIFNFILTERKFSWSECDLVHWTEGKNGGWFEDRRTRLSFAKLPERAVVKWNKLDIILDQRKTYEMQCPREYNGFIFKIFM